MTSVWVIHVGRPERASVILSAAKTLGRPELLSF